MTISGVSGGSQAYGSQQSNAVNSQFTQFFNNLQSLKTKDPEKLKSTLSDIADKLKTAADNATGPEKQKLTDLANKYEEASKTGDISGLKQGHRAGGHHRAGGPKPPPPPADGSSTAATDSQKTDMKALFDSISKEVSDALTVS